jgi:hypothetical protein
VSRTKIKPVSKGMQMCTAGKGCHLKGTSESYRQKYENQKLEESIKCTDSSTEEMNSSPQSGTNLDFRGIPRWRLEGGS